MKVNFTKTTYVNFDQIKIGEVFETDGTVYLKVGCQHAFDLFNNKLHFCDEWINLIPRESEITIY
jgi:hypothetical protein